MRSCQPACAYLHSYAPKLCICVLCTCHMGIDVSLAAALSYRLSLFFFSLHIFLFPVTKNNRTDTRRRFTSEGAGKIQATYSEHGRGIVRTINTRPFIRNSPCSKIICIVSIYFPRPRGHFRADKRLEGVRMPSGI